MNYTIEKATKKDIEMITSIKVSTMIDEITDKKLSIDERNKIREKIKEEIKEDYNNYNIIYIDKKKIGAYEVVPYKKGVMIDEIYIYEEYRNRQIGTNIINSIRKAYDNTYIWFYKENEDLQRLLISLGFQECENKNRIIIMKSNDAPRRILDKMSNIKLGYLDRKGNLYHNYSSYFNETFYLRKPEDIITSNIGTCFEQVELARLLLSKQDINLRTYFLLYQDGNEGASHSFIIYKDNKKYYWFENAWLKYQGIHEYSKKESAYLDIAYKFGKTIPNFKRDKLKLYEFEKPRFGINYEKYKNNALSGHVIRLSRG